MEFSEGQRVWVDDVSAWGTVAITIPDTFEGDDSATQSLEIDLDSGGTIYRFNRDVTDASDVAAPDYVTNFLGIPIYVYKV